MYKLVQVLVLLLVGAGAAQLAGDPAASRAPEQRILAAGEPAHLETPAAPARAPRVPAIHAGEGMPVQVTCVVVPPPEPPSVPVQASRLIRVVQGVPPRI